MEDRGLVVDSTPPAAFARALPASSSLAVWVFAGLVCCGIGVYAFTRAFVWDEGFHLVAAQMILAGKKPYLDFCFPQTPLNAYWNALWMRMFHPSWRVSHIPAALELAAAMLLLARYQLSRFPHARWRTASALAALAFFGVNATLFQFGPIAQAYAICTLTLLASFMLATDSVQRAGLARPFFSGLVMGCGAGSSLLVAPAAPVIVLWLWFKTNPGRRRGAKPLAFLAGCLVPFAPVFWLFALGPHQTVFNILQYQAIFRRADWKPDLAFTHDFDVLTGWYDKGQLVLLSCCVLAAVLFVRRHKEWVRFRSEYWLAFWISVALLAYISTAHPTFGRYYIVGMPLYAIVAAPGLMVIARRLGRAQPLRAAAVLVCLQLFGLLRAQVNDLDSATWQRYEDISAAVAQVTPPSARLYADEHVYFVLHRNPPSGMEFSYSHKADLPPKEAALLHIIPAKELKRQMLAGLFATVETCDDDKIDDWNLASNYKQRKDISDCSIFWQYQKQ